MLYDSLPIRVQVKANRLLLLDMYQPEQYSGKKPTGAANATNIPKSNNSNSLAGR
jgi:hypothetical protein